jgi:hypothetical protein
MGIVFFSKKVPPSSETRWAADLFDKGCAP